MATAPRRRSREEDDDDEEEERRPRRRSTGHRVTILEGVDADEFLERMFGSGEEEEEEKPRRRYFKDAR